MTGAYDKQVWTVAYHTSHLSTQERSCHFQRPPSPATRHIAIQAAFRAQ